MGVGAYFWYVYCVRIYNKFKWKDDQVSFAQDKNKNFTMKYDDIRSIQTLLYLALTDPDPN